MNDERVTPLPASFNWYLRFSGDFLTSLAKLLCLADPVNRERLRRAYPQVVAANESNNWDEPPAGFAPRYQAESEEIKL